jgi:hypothetical protein
VARLHEIYASRVREMRSCFDSATLRSARTGRTFCGFSPFALSLSKGSAMALTFREIVSHLALLAPFIK